MPSYPLDPGDADPPLDHHPLDHHPLDHHPLDHHPLDHHRSVDSGHPLDPDDGVAEPFRRRSRTDRRGADDYGEPAWSSWDRATHGPAPRPDWVITDGQAVDEDLGLLKTGKEADVSLLRRVLPATSDARSRERCDAGSDERPAERSDAGSGERPDERGGAGSGARPDEIGATVSLMAAKRYRPAERRLFHRDAGYTEGRRVRRSRENRAMSRRSEFGRELLAGQWAAAEFAALSRLWLLGTAVPYPVQLLGTEVLLEFVGHPDGRAAPRLAQCRPSRREAEDLFDQCRTAMSTLATAGWAHGDLSPYNLLVHDGRLVMIDLPQIIDVAVNPRGPEFLQRDCRNVCRWFAARGATADPDELFGDLMAEAVAGW